MPNKTTRAIVVANLLRLGFDAESAIQHGKTWAHANGLFSLDGVFANGLLDISETFVDVPERFGGSFVMSAHFGSLPHILRMVERRSDAGKVCVLVGEESEDFKTKMMRVAERTGGNLEFIDGGVGMIRRVSRILQEECPIVVAPDVPWGLIGDAPLRYQFLGGHIKARDGVHRLIEHLKAQRHYILSYASATGIKYVNYGPLDQSGCMRVLAQAVREHPEMYERLFQLHKYFVPAEETHDVVVFSIGSSTYALSTDEMRAWRLAVKSSSGEGLDSHIVRGALEAALQVKVDNVISLQ